MLYFSWNDEPYIQSRPHGFSERVTDRGQESLQYDMQTERQSTRYWDILAINKNVFVMFMLAIIVIETDNFLLQGKSFDRCLFSVHNEEPSYKSRTQDYSERFVDRHLHGVQAERQTTRYW